MTGKKKFPYWLAVEESKTVRFADLAHMMAKAMHPSEDVVMDYAAARINLEKELLQAVRDGLLRVRNRAGLGLHTFPHGDALQRAVLIPDTDLEPFLNARGIELRLTPHGSGPEYWTLENAAAAMQEQLNWHDGKRAEFQDQLQAAAQGGHLAILDPRTCLPIDSPKARTYWELVTPAGVNAWLEKLTAPYRWNPAPALLNILKLSPRDHKPWETLQPAYEWAKGIYMYQQAAREIADAEGWSDDKLDALLERMIAAIHARELLTRDRKTGLRCSENKLEFHSVVSVSDVNEWLHRKGAMYQWTPVAKAAQPKEPDETTVDWMEAAQQRAIEYIKEMKARDLYPNQATIADKVASEFRESGRVGKDGKPLSGAYIKRHALKGISSAIAKQLSTTKSQSK